MISVQNLKKRFGERVLFDDATFTINDGEHVGLVGRNGHGKSTLFKMLTGEEGADEGTIQIPRNYKIGFLRQDAKFTMPTVLSEACLSLPESRKGEEWRLKQILSGLGFSEKDFDRSPHEFSGGYQVRLHFTKVLASDPELLLLDEPTNFLDIVSIRWLISFLRPWKNELIVISHDRNVMDSITTHILGIHRGKMRKIAGKTGDYYRIIDDMETVHEKERVNQEKKNRQLEQFINKFRAKARQANLVQSRIKTLERQTSLSKLDKIPTLSFSFNYINHEAKYLLDASELSFSYNGEKPWLIDKISLNVKPDDRICVIGKNGKGKTTFLKLLAGKLKPLYGKVSIHPQGRMAYFEQANTALLRDSLTVEDEVISCLPEPDRKKARDICGAMMFSGDDALKRIGILSGGEKCRVLMGKLLASPSNLLLLDEPTHHLDMQSCESLMESIQEFEGAAVIVTHNERILDELATKLIVFHEDRIFIYPGPYQDFLNEIGWESKQVVSSSSINDEAKPDKDAWKDRKALKKTRAEFINRRSRIITPLKQSLDTLEKDISNLEQESEHNLQLLLEVSQKQDIAKMTELSRSIEHAKKKQEELYSNYIETHEKYELHKAQLDEEEKNYH